MCVCVFVQRFYGPVNPMGSCRARSVYLTTRLLGRLSPLTSIVHILLPETDNCPSWISGRERMTVENISWSISMKECWLPRRGLNPRPPGLQSDGASNWATEAGAVCVCYFFLCFFFFFFNCLQLTNIFILKISPKVHINTLEKMQPHFPNHFEQSVLTLFFLPKIWKSPLDFLMMCQLLNTSLRSASGDFCCLLITLANRLDPDQARQNVKSDLDPNCLTLWWYSWKNFLKKLLLKKSPQTTKWHAKLPNMQRVKIQ